MLNQEELLSSTSYTFKHVDSSIVDKFVQSHGGEQNGKHWVMMNVKWSKDYPLFTYGVATCLAPVLINNRTGEVGLGHLAYFYDPNFPKHSNGWQEERLEEAINRCRNDKGWELYLFGGQPLKDYGRNKRWFANHHHVIDRFNQAGVQCHNRINHDPDTAIDGIILDPTKKEILIAISSHPQ